MVIPVFNDPEEQETNARFFEKIRRKKKWILFLRISKLIIIISIISVISNAENKSDISFQCLIVALSLWAFFSLLVVVVILTIYFGKAARAEDKCSLLKMLTFITFFLSLPSLICTLWHILEIYFYELSYDPKWYIPFIALSALAYGLELAIFYQWKPSDEMDFIRVQDDQADAYPLREIRAESSPAPGSDSTSTTLTDSLNPNEGHSRRRRRSLEAPPKEEIAGPFVITGPITRSKSKALKKRHSDSELKQPRSPRRY